jgi:hypothetical protein
MKLHNHRPYGSEAALRGAKELRVCQDLAIRRAAESLARLLERRTVVGGVEATRTAVYRDVVRRAASGRDGFRGASADYRQGQAEQSASHRLAYTTSPAIRWRTAMDDCSAALRGSHHRALESLALEP